MTSAIFSTQKRQLFAFTGGFIVIASLALIFLAGLAMAAICAKIGIPRIIGMLVTGVVLGPYVCDYLSVSVLSISAELRQIALIIILVKAGLSLNIADLSKVGRPALLVSALPALCEIAAVVLFAPPLLGVSLLEAAIMGAVLGAVSPAIVVPRMVHLMENGYGTNKSIPQLLLAGSSLDDVFVIVLFTTFVSMAQGGSASMLQFAAIPVSIILGILLGAFAGWALAWLFETSFACQHLIRNSVKVIIVLGMAFLLMAIEGWLTGLVSFSGLLAVMSMATVLAMNSLPEVSERLSEKFGKLWLAAEVVLFVLVGAAVNVGYTLDAGLGAVAVILVALVFRSLGVLLCLVGTPLSDRERLYCVIAYIPKATVQAAIGGVPLALGLPCGNIVLSVAVVSILLTAPLGAWAMDISYARLLERRVVERVGGDSAVSARF